jgi:hypothetical protein
MKNSTSIIVGVLLLLIAGVCFLMKAGSSEKSEERQSLFVDRERPEITRIAKVSVREDREPIQVTMSGFRSAWGNIEKDQAPR